MSINQQIIQIPSHIRISGDNLVDRIVKEKALRTLVFDTISSDYKFYIKNSIFNLGQSF